MGLPGLPGGIGKGPWVSQARCGPAWGGGVGKRPWVSQARWGPAGGGVREETMGLTG